MGTPFLDKLGGKVLAKRFQNYWMPIKVFNIN